MIHEFDEGSRGCQKRRLNMTLSLRVRLGIGWRRDIGDAPPLPSHHFGVAR